MDNFEESTSKEITIRCCCGRQQIDCCWWTRWIKGTRFFVQQVFLYHSFFQTLNTVESFDLQNLTWQPLPPMNTHRHGLGVALVGGPLYATGGHGMNFNFN